MAEPIQFAGGSSDAALAAALQRLPMFPLPGVVLLPHALLPLHIFEERYRAMTRDALTGSRFIVVSLIAPGESETAEKPAVQRIAGVGEIMMAHELPDGRFNLVLRGRARIRIDEELASPRPYREVAATVLPDLPVLDRDELRDADQSLRALVGQLADAIPEGGEVLRQVVAAQDTPAELVDVLTAQLVFEPATRQRLLETREVMRRIERLSAEVVAMTSRLASPGPVN
ncbi:MAG TPA: LON peptidase substrate-binding domain-containing protein [Polyangia bacterium]|nr:LON peptidase substrate-binding domain-containing protein [Polyangia bacterium]